MDLPLFHAVPQHVVRPPARKHAALLGHDVPRSRAFVVDLPRTQVHYPVLHAGDHAQPPQSGGGDHGGWQHRAGYLDWALYLDIGFGGYAVPTHPVVVAGRHPVLRGCRGCGLHLREVVHVPSGFDPQLTRAPSRRSAIVYAVALFFSELNTIFWTVAAARKSRPAR